MAKFTNCLQIVNAMPEQDQDALLARLDKLQAQGMSPKEAQLQAAIDVLAQVEREGQVRRSPPRLSEDIPNESWLQGKIDYAERKGRNQWGVPHMSTVTGYFDKPIEVSLRVLSRLKGQRDEQNNVRDDSLEYIRKNWDEVSQQPPYIEVAYNGEAWVSEGNHRIMVAAEKGLESMPVEIRYFDGGQRRNGPLNPSRIPSLEDTGIRKSPERAANFERWSGGAPVIALGDEHQFRSGEPVVVEALHGTTNADLDEFKRSRANVESDMGAGFYASNTPEDVATNYANVDGPDLTQRVEQLAERLEEDFDGDMDAARDEARKRLSQGAPNTMKLFMRFKNPAVIGGRGETFLDYSEEYNEETEEYGEPTGALVNFVEALRDVAPGFNASDRDIESAIGKIFERAEGDGLKAGDALNVIKSELLDAYDDDGNAASSEIFRQALSEIGFDGVIDTTVYDKFGPQRRVGGQVLDRAGGMKGMTPDTVHFIAFEPEQIKSATGNNGEFGENPKILKSPERPQFYSQLQRAIEQVPDRLDNMGAVAWKQWLTANAPKLGVKAEEVEWSGIKDYLDLQGKTKLSKDDLARYLDDSGVKVGEVMLTQSPNEGVFIPEDSDEEYAPEPDRPTKYGTYTLPGGENYRELLITLPVADELPPIEQMQRRVEVLRELEADYRAESLDELAKKTADKIAKVEQSIQKAMLQKQKGTYQSSHWSEKNVVAHIRINDRTDADGNRVLFVEEVQSDWGQDGKKKGFQPSDAQIKANAERSLEIRKRVMDLRKQGFQTPDDGTPLSEIDPKFLEVQALLQEGEELRKQDSFYRGLPPSAPFVTKTEGWLNLALKRIAMMAVEGGYNKVAFVNGEQSADRYSLRKQVEAITATKKTDGKYTLLVETKNGQDNTFPNLDPQGMEDAVGKEMAQKIVDATSGDKRSARFSGLDLEVGGEGMKTFYDQIVPQAVSKLLPKLGGGKLDEVKIPLTTEQSTLDVIGSDGELILRTDYDSQAYATARENPGSQVIKTPSVESAPAQPGFDVTDKMRETVGAGVPLFSRDRAQTGADKPWFEDLSRLKVSTNYQLGDLLKTSRKLSWWDRTVGTQYNLATKQPEFKRVFDAVQSFINDVSAYATRAADMAPRILPKLDGFADINPFSKSFKKPLSGEDVKALRDPVFGGTLKYMRDKEGRIVETDDVQAAGVVFTDDELRSMFDLSDDQIGLYREFRSSVDQSVTDLALSDMVRYLGDDGRDIAETVMASGNVDVAVGVIESHLADLAKSTPQRAEVLGNTIEAIKQKGEQANRLMDRGYAPLSRFGQFTTYVVGKDGEQLYFGMFENERDAQKMAREMREQYPDATVSTSTMSQESYKLFSGVTPETLALFGESLGLEESGIDTKSEVFQQYLKVAKTNRSAMKRLIERKGIDGFSEDAGRVLAGFVYSNARQISTNLHAGEIGKAAADVKDGDVKDASIRLMEYIQNPQEEAQAIRGLMFTQFIGGSIASALVNMTQPFTMTAPYLAQFDGVTGASKRMADAMKLVTKGVRNDADLQDALKRAEDLGIVSPQEVHQLMAQARGKGSLITGDGTKVGDAAAKANNFTAKLGLAWGKAFSAAEQFNRRITFIAAYKLARDKGMADPMAFAEQAIAETQGIYNKGNKPAWARGAIGGTLFTFKQYSISYVEFLRRMWGNGPEGKKAVGLALGVLFMSAGLGGMPGADDLDDVIDGFAQRVLGKSFDSKQAKKEFFASILGQAGAEFVMGGLTGLPGAPIDLSGRLGLGNLIPGTGIFTKKSDYGRDVAEIFGPAGSLFKQVATGAGKLVQGDVAGAAKEVAPVAAQNVIKGVDMAVMGMYRDTKGRKVIDTDMWEAVAKGVGFQPASVKRVQDATGTQQNLIGQNKLRETEIADKWAAGRIEKNPAKVEEAKEMLADWNRTNPQSPIRIDASQINRRVQQAMMEKAKRLEKTAPKEIRQSVRQELERETN